MKSARRTATSGSAKAVGITKAATSSPGQRKASLTNSRRASSSAAKSSISANARGISSLDLTESSKRAVATSAVTMDEVQVTTVPTAPIEGQKTGTSGLRKKAKIFSSGNYLANWVQSLFSALGDEVKGQSIVLGGDGRWFNKEAAQIIIKIAAANGVKKVYVGQDAVLATPAASAIIRKRKLYGGLIMSASHNPGGPEEDWGIKFNYKSGEPAPEKITDQIFEETMKIDKILTCSAMADIDLAKIGETKFGDTFSVEVISSVDDYLELLKEVFDFEMISGLLASPKFDFVFDALHAVTGAYAEPILVDALGGKKESLKNCVPMEDFGGGHPDPNLTYAKELVALMFDKDGKYDFGAASDGDGDRNMILGKDFFITPSDSVAMIAANAQECIPYFKGGLKGVARSMPTSGALDRVAAKLDVPFFETPTGWKFFGNLMDADKCSICGEESFGTGGDHVREKDGMWAVLAWLSILAKKNEGKSDLVTVKDIAVEHWNEFGRNYFCRYDYEGCDSESANKMMDHLRTTVIPGAKEGTAMGPFTIAQADDFEYTDPIDGSVASKQGVRIVFSDGSRIIFRLSGTGSSGATIRMYIEQYEADKTKMLLDAQEALKPIIETALEISKLQEFTGRDKPTVIT